MYNITAVFDMYSGTTQLHHYNIYQLLAVESMPPAAPPLVHIARFPRCRSRHPADVIQHKPTGDDHSGLIGVVSLAERVLPAEQTIVDDLIRETADKVRMQGSIDHREGAEEEDQGGEVRSMDDQSAEAVS